MFGSWLLVVRGELRRTGHRGVSLRATGAWSLPDLHDLWGKPGPDGGIEAVRARMGVVSTVEEVTHRRVLVHSSGFQMSPYADVKPAGEAVKAPARKPWVEEVAQQPSRNLWHRSPGSPG